MDIKISIIVPIYNGEKYIKKCVDSLISQTLKEIEIILINDGSTDNTKEIIEGYSKIDKRIKVINKENSGPGASRNIGINSAVGEFVGFVDADDFVENNMYERLYKSIDGQDIDIVMCNYKEINIKKNESNIINHGLDINKIYYKEEIKEHIIKTFSENGNYGFYSLCNKIYSDKFLKKNNMNIVSDREHGEDWLFNINAFIKAESCKFISEALYNYNHINENSLMVKYRENQFELCLDGRRSMFDIIPTELINKKSLDIRFIYEFSSYIIGTFNNVNDRKKQKELIYNVLKNKDVIDSCENNNLVSLHFKIETYFIRKNKYKISYLLYKFMWIIKFKD